jgi:Abnormal spindle-like microcephaly-assoc'd, ASPM-SPD-2-Hydin
LAIFILLSGGVALRAQLSQPFVYTTGGAVATRNDQSGALTPIQGSPFGVLGFPATIDAKGRFIFAAGNNSVHMFKVDSTMGTYSEVAGSPFASGNTKSPILIATEPTGMFVAVVNSIGLNPGESSVESFEIDAAGEALVPVAGSFLELVSSPIGAGGNSTLGTFWVYLGPNLLSSNSQYQHDGDLLTYTIDPSTGLLGTETGANGSTDLGRSFSSEPLGQFVVTGQGQVGGILEVHSAAGEQGSLSLGPGVFPQEILVGPGQRFVYVTLFSGPQSQVHIYIVDTNDWTLTESPSSPLPGFASVAGLVADPSGPFVYQSTAANQVRVYAADLATGYLTEITGSPLTGAGLGAPIAFSVNAGAIQPESGPVATFTPTGLTFASTAVGASAQLQSLALSSTGNQALIVNAITVTGLNASEFTESDNCGPPTVLQPNSSCFVSIIFAPAGSGLRQAQIAVTDNAPGSPQSAPLTGTGAGSPQSAPAISFAPATLNFSAVSLGSSSVAMALTVTNSGNAPLAISALVLGGNNAADFGAPSSICVGAPLAPNASCTVMETFTPAATGARSATLTFTDNAAGSPHTVLLSGSGVGATGPALRFSPTPVNFPAVTQGLTSTPLNVMVTNSGNAPMHIMGITAGGNTPGDFVNTLGGCSAATVAPGTSCMVNVSFSPTDSGPVSETLSVSDDAPNSPQVLNVLANGAASFTVTSAANALSASVTAGQTATYTLQLTPGMDFNGTVTFSCTGAPLAATCQMPASVTLNIGTPATLTVTVSTSGKGSAFPEIGHRERPRWHEFLARVAFMSVLATVWWLILLARRTTERQKRFGPAVWPSWRKSFALVVSMVLIFLPAMIVMQGCGGGSSTTAPQGNFVVTPSGTSMLVVTPSGNSLSGKPLKFSPIQLTLVVN